MAVYAKHKTARIYEKNTWSWDVNGEMDHCTHTDFRGQSTVSLVVLLSSASLIRNCIEEIYLNVWNLKSTIATKKGKKKTHVFPLNIVTVSYTT